MKKKRAKGRKKASRKRTAAARPRARKARASKRALPIPAGLRSVTPHLVIQGGADAIEFYKKAFGAREVYRHMGPDGKALMHARVRIGDSAVFLADEFPGSPMRAPRSVGGTTVAINIYVRDADALWDKAVKAGAKVTMPLADQFWGDRYGQVEDPFGHLWAIATHKEDLKPAEMAKRAAEVFSKMK